METELSLEQMQRAWHGSLRSYVIGIVACILLTSLSFYLVIEQVFSASILIYAIAGLALTQATLQLFYFLHLGQEGKPHWETIIFLCMFLILLIIALGSLWVMGDLKHRTMDHNMETMVYD